jgi:hypothetical protein
MINLIFSKYSHLLYKDETSDTFLLTMYVEIYQKSETILKCSCWNKKVFSSLKKTGLIFNEWETSDKLFIFETESANLPLLIATGSHSRRVSRYGRWLRDKEKRLGHKIIPYNPLL